MNVLGKEDPYLKIGQTNDRTTKGESEYVWALRDISFKVEQGEVLASSESSERVTKGNNIYMLRSARAPKEATASSWV